MNQREQISEIIFALGEYYDKNLTQNQIAMYVEDLIDLDATQLVEAIKRYRLDPKNDRFPLPVKLKAMIGQAVSPDDAARDASSRIIAAVAKYGWNNPDRARDYVGELGWEIVKRQGGWMNLCESLTYDNQGMLQAQWRELAVSVQRSGTRTRDTGPSLPSPEDSKKLLSFMRDIPK